MKYPCGRPQGRRSGFHGERIKLVRNAAGREVAVFHAELASIEAKFALADKYAGATGHA